MASPVCVARDSVKSQSDAGCGAAVEMNIRRDPSGAFGVKFCVPSSSPDSKARQSADASLSVPKTLVRWLRPDRDAWSKSRARKFHFETGKRAFVISVDMQNHECAAIAVAKKRIHIDRIAEGSQRMRGNDVDHPSV